jgi:hypothetical protein
MNVVVFIVRTKNTMMTGLTSTKMTAVTKRRKSTKMTAVVTRRRKRTKMTVVVTRRRKSTKMTVVVTKRRKSTKMTAITITTNTGVKRKNTIVTVINSSLLKGKHPELILGRVFFCKKGRSLRLLNKSF